MDDACADAADEGIVGNPYGFRTTFGCVVDGCWVDCDVGGAVLACVPAGGGGGGTVCPCCGGTCPSCGPSC